MMQGNVIYNEKNLNPYVQKTMNSNLLRVSNKEAKERYVRENLEITLEEYELIDGEIDRAFTAMVNARDIIYTRPMPGGDGVQTYTYKTLSGMSAADISMDYKKIYDRVKISKTSTDVPILQREWEIKARDLSSSRNSGGQLDVQTASEAAYVLKVLEDDYIVNGFSFDGSTYDIAGMYQSALNDDSTTLAWSTKTNIETSIKNAVTLLVADKVYGQMGGYNEVINPQQEIEAKALLGTNNTSDNYEKVIENYLKGGQILVTDAITVDTGMVTGSRELRTPTGARAFEYLEFVPPTHEEWMEPGDHNLYGREYMVTLPVIKQGNAICKQSDI